MTTQRRYRIESDLPRADVDAMAAQRHEEILAAIASMKDVMGAQQQVSSTILDDLRKDMHEALRLKTELDAISGAIQKTKQEIATLRYAGARGQEISRVTDELGAIVVGTEEATNTILSSSEKIDELAGQLAARVAEGDKELAQEISEHVVAIFEACNFQDITGQRIGKVVNAMRFVEERVDQMIQIWGGLESFKDIELLEEALPQGDNALLNGPALETDEGRTSQDAIDALFG